MLRNKFIGSLVILTVILGGAIVSFAQSAPVRGKVELKKADGSVVPVAGALVEPYRTDTKGKLPPAKTAKNGTFSFAGFPLGQTFVLSVSAPGARSDIYPNVKAGMEEIAITLYEGDGKALTEDEVRKAVAGGSQSQPQNNEEAKKAQAEYEKKKAEVEAGNKKIDENNKAIGQLFTQGNEAYNAGNADLAVNKYSEAIAIDPSHPAMQQLLTNRSLAFARRGVASYNASVKATDAEAKASGLENAKKDWSSSVEDAQKARALMKEKSAPTDPAELNNFKANQYNVAVALADGLRLVASRVDQSKAGEMATAYEELLALETDPLKKAKTHLTFAKAAFDAQDFDRAVAEFEKILADDPDNIDALSRSGLSLVNVGYISNDKAKFQQGANYLAKYVELAPEGHEYKNDAKGLLDTLKREQNITAQKPTRTTTTKKKN